MTGLNFILGEMANVPVHGQPVQAGYALCVYGVSQSVGSWGTGIAST